MEHTTGQKVADETKVLAS